MLANAYRLPCIEGVRVHQSGEFPTHKLLQVKLAIAKLAVGHRKLKNTDSAVEAIKEKIAKMLIEVRDVGLDHCKYIRKSPRTERTSSQHDERKNQGRFHKPRKCRIAPTMKKRTDPRQGKHG